MGFESWLSERLDGKRIRETQAVAASRGLAAPPSGNRWANFLPFPPGSDPTLGRSLGGPSFPMMPVLDNNSPRPVISAVPPGGSRYASDGIGSRVTPAGFDARIARGTVQPPGWFRRGNRVGLQVQAAAARMRTRIRGY